MKNSTDHYYDDYNMSDLRLLSSIGFNEDDIKAIRAVDGVKECILHIHRMQLSGKTA